MCRAPKFNTCLPSFCYHVGLHCQLYDFSAMFSNHNKLFKFWEILYPLHKRIIEWPVVESLASVTILSFYYRGHKCSVSKRTVTVTMTCWRIHHCFLYSNFYSLAISKCYSYGYLKKLCCFLYTLPLVHYRQVTLQTYRSLRNMINNVLIKNFKKLTFSK